MEGGVGISLFVALIATVVSQECQYPIQLPEVLSVSNRPEHGLPRAQIVLRTPHVVEQFLFWASDTKFLTMQEIFRTKPAYYPIYKGVASIEPVHTQDGEVHTFSLYTPRQVMVHILSVQIFVGCQTLDLNFLIKPDEIGANLSLPLSLGQIWNIPPLETVYTEGEWLDLRLEYENEMRAQHAEFYFKNETDQDFRNGNFRDYTDHFIIDETNSGQNMSGSIKKIWARAKAASGTKELIVIFTMYQFSAGESSLPVYISLFSSFHSNAHSKPFIGVFRCTWFKPKGFEENGTKVIPMEGGEQGCVHINAFGNPTSEVAVARMTGKNQVGDFLHPPGRKYQSRHELVNGNIYHVDGVQAGKDQHFVVAAKNAFGSTFVGFTIRGYAPISIKSNCSEPACDSQGVVRIQELDQVITLTCNIEGPVRRVIFFIAHDYEITNPNVLNEVSKPLLDSTIPDPGSSRPLTYYLNADQERIEALRGADVYCGAFGQYDNKMAKFDMEINPDLLDDSGYNSTSVGYPFK